MPAPAPVCKAALAEATRLWPNRSRASDGIVADPNHSPSSDHADPDRDGYAEAFDLTHDPSAGCDAHALVRAAVARRDRRIKLAISNGRIWSAARAAEGWRPYSGPNPHTRHAHVSTADAARDDTSPWWTTPVTNPQEEDDMALSDDDRRLIETAVAEARDAKHYAIACLAALNELDQTTTVDIDAEAVARRVDELLARRLAE